MTPEPQLVSVARRNAASAGFTLSSETDTGRLLATLAAAVPPEGSVLELGTGFGVGTAWIVEGLGSRSDVRVVTVESVPATSAAARRAPWPGYVEFLVGDAVALLPDLGRFDLVFADAQGGKWSRLDLTVAALRPGGFLVVDDMTPQDWWSDDQRQRNRGVTDTLTTHPELAACSLDFSTGIVLAARRVEPLDDPAGPARDD